MKQVHVWGIFFALFAGLSIWSIVEYMNKNNCDVIGPTISSSLFTDYIQGITIVLFLLGAFAFKQDKEKLFVIALVLFGFAFIHDNNGVHITTVMVATGILWITVIHKFYLMRNEATAGTYVSMFLLVCSIISGVIFFTLFFESWSCIKTPEEHIIKHVRNGEVEHVFITDIEHPDGKCNKVPCSSIAWYEYATFALLFGSTYVLVPDQVFYLFEDPEPRKKRTVEDQEAVAFIVTETSEQD